MCCIALVKTGFTHLLAEQMTVQYLSGHMWGQNL